MIRHFFATATILILGLGLSSPGAAQTRPDIGEIQENLRLVLDNINMTSVVAGLINLGTTRDTRASSLKIDRDPPTTISSPKTSGR